jgi:2-oxoglutarate ferredoxin oxidoreductase subunit alpha
VGLLQIVTVWPFPKKLVSEVCKNAKAVIVPEMNLGQMAGEVEKAVKVPVISVNRVDSLIITPGEILAKIEEVAK